MTIFFRILSLVVFLFGFLALSPRVYAYVPPDTCGCNPNTDPGGLFCCYSLDCAGNQSWTNESTSICQAAIGAPPSNFCDQNTYQFTYYVCQTQMSPSGPTCRYQYQFAQNQCSAVDRCLGSNQPASGFDPNGNVVPGICNAGNYNGIDPNTACTSGGVYKVCCTAPGGTYPNTACQNGVCPYGQITQAGVTSCATATPTPTPTPSSTGCSNAPTTSPDKGVEKTVYGSCNPDGQSCETPCSDTCTIDGSTCSATSCKSWWQCQGGIKWYNNGTYYSNCPTSCKNCTPGQTKTTCSTTLDCRL